MNKQAGERAPVRTYVIWLEVPESMRVRRGPVTITWPDGETVEAGVLGAQFTSPDEFARDMEAGGKE